MGTRHLDLACRIDEFNRESILMLHVKLFAQARHLVNSSEIEIAWNDGDSVAKLKESLAKDFPQLQPLVPRLLVAINNDYAGDDRAIQSTDEVACFPPVSGG